MTLVIQVVLGHWYVMAYTVGPKYPCDRVEGHALCLQLARQQAPLEAVNPVVVLLIWVGVDIAVLLAFDRWWHTVRRTNKLGAEVEGFLANWS